jgi:hypothetical protein
LSRERGYPSDERNSAAAVGFREWNPKRGEIYKSEVDLRHNTNMGFVYCGRVEVKGKPMGYPVKST